MPAFRHTFTIVFYDLKNYYFLITGITKGKRLCRELGG